MVKMRNQLLTLILAFGFALYSFFSFNIEVLAAETIDNITIQIPGCNVEFPLSGVDVNYGIGKDAAGKTFYEFYFPNSNGSVLFNEEANIEVVGVGGGKTLYKHENFPKGWTFSSSTVNGKGSAITAFKNDGTLIKNSKDDSVGRIVFCVGYDSSAFLGGKLYPISGLQVNSSLKTTDNNLEIESLNNYTGNDAEFNAYYYYVNNPDLQSAIGADGDALFKHWVEYGKAEGRIANQ